MFLLACLPYLNTIANGFVYDDLEQILDNPFVASGHYLKQIFTTPVWAFKTLATDVEYFRPMMNLTYLGLHKIYGAVAPGYHIFCVLLAGWIACLVYSVTRRWTRDELFAIVAAALFALHPVHSEAVAWIGDITDLEVTLFILLAFWAYLALPKTVVEAWLNRVAVAFFFLLALFSKEIAVALPPLATLFEHLYRDDRAQTRFSTKVARYAPFWVVLGLYFVYRRVVLGSMVTLTARRDFGIGETIASGLQLFAHYVAKLLWPQNLVAFYVFTAPKHFWDLTVVAGLIALIVLFVAALVLLRSQPIVSFGIVWLLAFLALALNVRWLAAAAFAERYLFLPSLGFAWIVAFYSVKIWRETSWRPKLVRSTLAGIACILAILSFVRIYTRNRIWHDNGTLYERTLQQEPHAVNIRINLGGVYWMKGEKQRALEEWMRAHEESPKLIPPIVNLAMAAVLGNDSKTAEMYLQEGAKISDSSSSLYLWWGRLYAKEGRFDLAEQKYLYAEKFAPYDSTVHAELAQLYLSQNRLGEAAAQFRVSAIMMNDPLYWDQLGDIYIRLGNYDEAKNAFTSALDANPYFSESHVGLGQVYEKWGDSARAREEYQKGLKNNPNNPIALAGLARLRGKQP